MSEQNMDIYREDDFSYVSTQARIAVYDDMRSAPRVFEIESAPTAEFIESIATTTYESAQRLGGKIPYTAIREIAENFIHASFQECTVSVLDGGNTISFSDQGPGIARKILVQRPGVTSATAEMKRYIRGVGSGFPLVNEYLQFSDGTLTITDNAKEGTVVTLSINLPQKDLILEPTRGLQQDIVSSSNTDIGGASTLNNRETAVLRLMYEHGVVGPSDLTEPLGISAATAYRLLEKLEQAGYVEQTIRRKRILSNSGLHYLESLG